MNDDRSLSALLGRLEALSWREGAQRAKATSQRLVPRDARTGLTTRRARKALAWLVVGGVLAAGAFAGYCHFAELDGAPRAECPTARVSGPDGSVRP